MVKKNEEILGYITKDEFVTKDKEKQRVLNHYAETDPKEFVEYDIFTDPHTWDDIVTPNSVWEHRDNELFKGYWSVRVLAKPSMSDKEIITALEMIIKTINGRQTEKTIFKRKKSI